MDERGPGEPGEAAVEQLLRHTEWLRRLAASLVVDAALADDVAQQTLLLALQRPPASDRHPKAWLATVARNVARTFARGEQRRESRERLAATDVRLPATDDLVAQATLHHAVVGAVLAIEEPYRSLLLRRWFEEKKPGALARELGVPVETVRTRLKRGLELVREELVRRRALPGGVVALVALLDGTARAMAVKGITAGGAAAGIGAAAAGAAAGAGVVVMTAKTKVAVASIAIVALALVSTRYVVDRWPEKQGDAASIARGEAAARTDAVEGTASPAEHADVAALRELSSAVAAVAAVQGIVVDEEGGPVAGAQVGWLAPTPPLDERADRLLAPPFEWAAATVAASATGSFELPWSDTLAGGGTTLDVVALAPGFEPALWPRARAGDQIVVRLRHGIECAGSVRDLSGAPVAGATLRWRVHGERLISETATSDADGSFRFERAWPTHGSPLARVSDTTWIDVAADGFAPATFFAHDNVREVGERHWQLDVWLVRGATIRGQVVDQVTGAPIEGADVWLRMFDTRAGRAALRTRSGNDGRFVLEHVPAWGVTLVGMHHASFSSRRLGRVCALHQGHGMVQVGLDVPDDGKELTFRLELPRLGGVRGRVVDPQGAPVAAALVYASGSAAEGRHDRGDLDGGALAYAPPTRTDGEGRYQIDGLAVAGDPGTTTTLSAHVEFGEVASGPSATAPVALESGRVVEAPDLVVVPPTVVRVDVVDEQGRPVAGAIVRSVTPKGEGFEVDGPWPTDVEGRCWFQARSSPVGVRRLAVVTSDGFARAEQEIVPDARELRVGLQPEHRLHGRVVDGDGRPVVASVVAAPATRPVDLFRASIDSGELWLRATCDLESRVQSSAGWFELRGLVAGPWHVVAFASRDRDGKGAPVAFAAEVSETDGELELVFEESVEPPRSSTDAPDPATLGRVELTLTFVADGRPVLRGGAARLQQGERYHFARAIAPGRYVFEQVPAGRYDLVVDVPGSARGRDSVAVVAGGSASVALAIDEGIVARGRAPLPDVASIEKATLFFASDDGGGGASGELQRDGAYEVPGLVAGKSYRRWLHVKESEEQSSLWIADGPALLAADAARDEALKWQRAGVVLAYFAHRERLGNDASLTLRNEAGEVVWTKARLNPNANFERLLPIGSYQVELTIPGRATETQTAHVTASDRSTELWFLVEE